MCLWHKGGRAHLNTVLEYGRDALLRVRERKSSKLTFY
jgi:hypothetical protein